MSAAETESVWDYPRPPRVDVSSEHADLNTLVVDGQRLLLGQIAPGLAVHVIPTAF